MFIFIIEGLIFFICLINKNTHHSFSESKVTSINVLFCLNKTQIYSVCNYIICLHNRKTGKQQIITLERINYLKQLLFTHTHCDRNLFHIKVQIAIGIQNSWVSRPMHKSATHQGKFRFQDNSDFRSLCHWYMCTYTAYVTIIAGLTMVRYITFYIFWTLALFISYMNSTATWHISDCLWRWGGSEDHYMWWLLCYNCHSTNKVLEMP